MTDAPGARADHLRADYEDNPLVDTRVDPPMLGNERSILSGFLDFHRATLELKCAGLTPEQLATRAVPPSPLTLLGILRHVTEVERSWFMTWGELEEPEPLYYSDADPDGDFHVGDPARVTTEDVQLAWDNWQDAVAYSRDVVTRTPSLDAVSKTRRGQPVNLRWIVVHLIEEYSRHNGHADLLREAIDGTVGE